MPVPKPSSGESERAFVSRCISTMSHRDPDRERDQIVAVCYGAWRESKGEKRAPEFEQLLQYLCYAYGKRAGTAYYLDWLEELGYNDAVPMVLQKKKTIVLSRRMPADRHDIMKKVQSQLSLEIVDSKNHVVAGYASTPIRDCDGDEQYIQTIEQAAKRYREGGDVVYAFHRNEPAGIILDDWTTSEGKKYTTHIDKVGWYVVSRPTENYWKLFQKDSLNGYSVGWESWHYDDEKIVDEVVYDDLSYVPYSCNPLCFLGRAKSNPNSCSSILMKEGVGHTAHITSKEGKNLNDNKTEKLEVAKTEFLKEFPDAKEKVEAIECIDDLTKLTKELVKAKEKEEAERVANLPFKEKMEVLMKQRDKAVEERMLAEMQKKIEGERERKKKVESMNFEEKVLTSFGEIDAKLKEFTQKVATIETTVEQNTEKIAKLGDVSVIKGHGIEGGKPESVIYRAMTADLMKDPLALQKLGTEGNAEETD